ncbi:unnamed protein product [Clonostachys byssicola]|uniref:Xylanolytic transcriptional activator regulatory domain-containing protein n=1 Tax=Clonostachys byssicola TaxID=160290 RepID=A0A9N9UKP9_9HYPO|nr:unnamed protein product [Clonostachys byssicola]
MFSSRPLTKRPRAAIACNRCRQAKAKVTTSFRFELLSRLTRSLYKCDSERPQCGRCAKEESECVYSNDGRRKRQAHQRQVREYALLAESDLSVRVRDIEVKLASVCGSVETVPDTFGLGSEPIPIPWANDNENSSVNSSIGPYVSSFSQATPSYTESFPDVRATGLFDHPSTTDMGYFGSSSNHALFRSITAEIINIGYNHAQHSFEPFGRCQGLISGNRVPGQISTDITSTETGYPERRVALELISRFSDSTGAVLPFATESALVIEACKISADAELAPGVRALLDIVFAHALVSADENAANALYLRAFHILEIQSQHLPSLESLRACLLLVSFQQNTRRAISSWSPHCLAVKMAYELGVHAPFTYKGLNSQDKDARLNLWLGVVTQDRILSSALGRPSLIPSHHVKLDVSRYLDSDRKAEQPIPMSLKESYFRHLTNLHRITGQAIDDIYDHNMGISDHMSFDDLVAKTVDLSRKLDQWRVNSSPFEICQHNLKSSIPLIGTSRAEGFENLLSIHYYRTVLLANGQLLLRILQESTSIRLGDMDISHQIAIAPLQRDYTAAKELSWVLSIISTSNSGFFESNATWWVCNYGVLTLCLHLMGVWILSLSNPAYFGLLRINPSEVQTLLKEAVDTLKVIGGESLMSRKAHHCIRQYIEFLASSEQRMESNDLVGMDQAVPWAAHTNVALDNEPNLGDFLHSLDSEDALLGGGSSYGEPKSEEPSLPKKMLESAATTLASIVVLALGFAGAAYIYHRSYKWLVLRKMTRAFEPGDPVLELAAIGKDVPHKKGGEADYWVLRPEQDRVNRIVSGEEKGHYFLLVGEKGTGKSSMLIEAMRQIDGDAVSMFEAHPDTEIFRQRLGKALDYEFHEDYIGGYFSERGPRESTALLDIERALNKLEKVAMKMRSDRGKPLIVIVNQMHLLRNVEEGRDLIELLQQRAEQWAAADLVTMIFNSDDFWVYERLKQLATRMEVIPIHDLPRKQAVEALKNYRLRYRGERLSDSMLEQIYAKVGGRVSFLNRVAKSDDMLAKCESIKNTEKRWFLNQCWILGAEMDDDVMDQQKWAAAAMTLALALVDKEKEMDQTYSPEEGHILPSYPFHIAQQIMTRCDFIREMDSLNLLTITHHADVRASSVPMQHAFKEICSQPDFREFLEATMNRIADIESLGRTRELVAKDLVLGGQYEIEHNRKSVTVKLVQKEEEED